MSIEASYLTTLKDIGERSVRLVNKQSAILLTLSSNMNSGFFKSLPTIALVILLIIPVMLFLVFLSCIGLMREFMKLIGNYTHRTPAEAGVTVSKKSGPSVIKKILPTYTNKDSAIAYFSGLRDQTNLSPIESYKPMTYLVQLYALHFKAAIKLMNLVNMLLP